MGLCGVQVVDNWEGAPGAVVVVGGRADTREGQLLAWANEMEATITAQVCCCLTLLSSLCSGSQQLPRQCLAVADLALRICH